MKRKPTVTYVVSSDTALEHAPRTIRRTGRQVRSGAEVLAAGEELVAKRRYVVVAHGTEDAVFWSAVPAELSTKWLWVGMPAPPTRVRVYLYACHAGKGLAARLRKCQCFGHRDVVPVPVGGKDDVVLRFLDRVDELMRGSSFDVDEWRAALTEHIEEALAAEADGRRRSDKRFDNAHSLHLLNRSLRFPSD